MGKATAAQIKAKAMVDKLKREAPERVPREGVIIRMVEGDDLLFDGDFEVQLTPGGVACLVEMVPDVANKNKGLDIPVIRQFVNSTVWTEIIVK